ncbi:MAG: LPS export ABC transporter permease LptG [Deltaproteobacteria bacterium]|nr:LPS export ABC transporter permease LptG [Deltaproteobacteria bacterium]
MSIIDRYLIREILRMAAIVLVMVVGVYLAVDFFEKVDNFLEKNVPLDRALAYLTYKLPFIVAQVMPLGLLLAVTITFGLMNKRNELLALRAGGVGLGRLMRPIVALGILSTILLFFLSEAVVPPTMDRANRIWRGEVRQEAMLVSRQHNIWVKGRRSIVFLQHYHGPSRTAYGLTVNRFDDDFRLVERLDAEAGSYRDGRWRLVGVMAQRRRPGGGAMTVTFHDTLTAALELAPEDLSRAAREGSEMSYGELRRHVERMAAEGYDAGAYRVDLQAKLAFPVICLILAVVGAGIGLHRLAHRGLALAVAIGLGLAFLYWVFFSFCLSLGYGEMLPPLVAAWAANLLFACIAGVVMLAVD